MKPVIFFDSGIGGTSILQKFSTIDPAIKTIYFADQANFPYGNKSKSWIEERVRTFVKWSQDFDPLAIVIACNSATTQAISSAREQTTCPIIGVEPLVKPLLNFQSSLLLMTESSLNSDRTQALLKLDTNDSITTFSPPGLAEAIEDMDEKGIDKILFSLLDIVPDPEAIGLSCTHYPLLMSKFQNIFPKTQIIDPSEAVIARLNSVLDLEVSEGGTSATDWYTTGPVVRLENQLQYYSGLPDKITKVSL